MASGQNGLEETRDKAAHLLAQARAKSQEVERAVVMAGGDSALMARLSRSASQLSAVESRLALALSSPSMALSPTDLLAFGEVVHSGEISALVNEAAAKAAGSASLAAAQVAAAAIETRRETQSLAHDVFDRRIFDPYLQFASPEDEAEFRRRQAEAERYVRAQLARGTPEGDLNAGGGTLGAMLDAHAHGAGRSPEFLPRWNALVDRTQRQHAAMQAAGQSTEEYDRMLNGNVRRFLQAKGLSEAEIDQHLTGAASPLDAVRPFLGNDRESRSLGRRTNTSAPSAAPAIHTEASATATIPDPPSTLDLDAMTARLRAAGVVTGEHNETAGHGLNAQRRTAPGPNVGS